MYQLRLFGFGIELVSIADAQGYPEVPLTIMRQDRSSIIQWLEYSAPHLFASGYTITYEIWHCIGTVPVQCIESGTIQGQYRTTRSR